MRVWIASLWCAAALGCFADADYGDTRFRCAEEPSCPGGYDCIQGRCVPAGTVDPATPGPFRRQLTVDNGGRERLEGFPVLIVLDPSRIDYAASPEGANLRFTAAGELTLLPHQIDTWNPGGESLVWVRVPELPAGGAASLEMYWGGDAPPPARPATDTWDERYVGVWHLDEDPAATPVADDAAGRFSGTPIDDGVPTLVAGPLGGALRFELEAVSFGDQPEFELPTYSWSMWLRGDEAPINTMSGNGQPLFNADSQFNFAWSHTGAAFVKAATHEASGGFTPAQIATQLSGGVWYHVAATYDGTNLRVFLDGRLETSIPIGPPLVADGPLTIGNDPDTPEFTGELDEVRVLGEAVSPDWIAAAHASDLDQLVSYGELEQLF